MSKAGLIAVFVLGCGGGGGTGVPEDAPSGSDGKPAADASTNLGPTFRFAIVGDTRPANEDDTAHYPTPIITKIFADIEAASPHPDFAVSTGDYQFSNPTGTQATAQLHLYMTARAQFTNALYPALGNHECTGATDSNCGTGNANGITNNYTAFMTQMLQPIGIPKPYYVYNFAAQDGSWTAKVVVIAANAWDATQSAWLTQTLAQPTTYTFVVRHEDHLANTAPGVTPSETIISAHPYTLKIVGHTHTYSHYSTEHEVICGNGGAPLTSSTNYGYAIVERLATGKLQFTEYDYMTNAVKDQFRFNADGSAAP
jgi:calcineurin-like phosphoesterase family protein